MRGKGAAWVRIPYGAGFSAASRPKAAHGAGAVGSILRLHNSALSEAGGFSDAPQRGALPAFDNVALCKSRSRLRRAASLLPQALLNSDESSGPPLRRYRRVACPE